MARPIDPTSQLQVEKRATWLRSEESGWTQSLALAIAMAAFKAWQWSHYLENGGEAGPLAGTFPRLPEEPGSWVLVGASEVTDLSQTQTEEEGKAMGGAEPDRTFWGFGPARAGEAPRRLHLLRGDQWLVDGQADGCEAPDTEQLAMAMELASLLQERHLHLLLRPAFYKEVAVWIGELLKAPRPKTYSPPESDRTAIWVDPKNWEVLGTEVPMDGVSALLGAPGSPWPGDLWRVPAAPLGIPSDEALHLHDISAEELAVCAACWHFGREVYRKLLDPRPNALGQSGLERPALLRQLLEELEVVSPRGLPVRSVAGKPVASMASHEVAALGLRAFPRADMWSEEDGRGRFLHERTGRRWQVTMATGAGEELAFKSLAQCRKLLTYKNTGLEITSLHALLCCYVMQCQEPGSRFVVSGDDLLRDLGLEARRKGGLTRSDLLKEIGKWASLLGLAQCEGYSRPKDREMISMELGPMWSISIHANGQLQLLENDPRPDTLTDLSLTVTPGTWAQTPQWATREASHLLYAPIATEILQLGRHRRELAFRLGIHLALGFRERTQWRGGKANLRVGQLLEEVLPQGTLDRARGNRDEASRLRAHWGAALGTLRDAVGFRFEFPDCPGWLIPPDFPDHEDATAPHGALELLLNSRVVILWPEKVVEARLQKPLAQIQERETQKLIRQTQARLLNQRPTDNAAQLKAAREATGMSQREVAPRLGIARGYLSQLESGAKPLTREKLRSLQGLLKTVKKRNA